MFNKLKQIFGNSPIERKHLGQYNYLSNVYFKGDEEQILGEKRIISNIWLEVYSGNSAKIVFENATEKRVFHLIQLPFPGENGGEVFMTKTDDGTLSDVTIGIYELTAIFFYEDSQKGLALSNL